MLGPDLAFLSLFLQITTIFVSVKHISIDFSSGLNKFDTSHSQKSYTASQFWRIDFRTSVFTGYGAVLFVVAWALALSFTFEKKFPICVGSGSRRKAPIYVRACMHSFLSFTRVGLGFIEWLPALPVMGRHACGVSSLHAAANCN